MNALPEEAKSQIKSVMEAVYWEARRQAGHGPAMAMLACNQWVCDALAEATPEIGKDERSLSRAEAMAAAAYIRTLTAEFARKGTH